MTDYILVIDRGSTNVKAVLFDTKGVEIKVSSQSCQENIAKHAGWYEQDMVQIWSDTVTAIQGLYDDTISADQIIGVGVTGQGNGLYLTDEAGIPVRNGILSHDSRAENIYNCWKSDGLFSKALEVTRFPFVVGGPFALLKWIKENEPENYDKARRVLFVKDWIKYKLTDTCSTDPTDVSGSGLLDLDENSYANEIFSLLGIGDALDKMCTIIPSDVVAGKVTEKAAEETGLREGIPVISGAHDIASFPFGIGSVDSSNLVSALGTWGINLLPVESYASEHVVFTHSVPGLYLTGIGDANSGLCIEKMVEIYFKKEIQNAEKNGFPKYAFMESVLEKSECSQIIFHPYLFGSVTDDAASASFFGVKSWHTKEDLIRAVYEGVVFNYYSNIRMIKGSEKLKTLWLIGGGSKSLFLGQLFADITGFTVNIAKTEEVTARGTALHTLVGLGVLPCYQDACIPVEVKMTFTPDIQTQSFYNRKYDVFVKLAESLGCLWGKIDNLTSESYEDERT